MLGQGRAGTHTAGSPMRRALTRSLKRATSRSCARTSCSSLQSVRRGWQRDCLQRLCVRGRCGLHQGSIEWCATSRLSASAAFAGTPSGQTARSGKHPKLKAACRTVWGPG